MAEVGAAGDQGQVKQDVDELAKQVDAIAVDEVFYRFEYHSEKVHIEKGRETISTKSSSTIPWNNRKNQVVQYSARLWFY